MRTDDPVKRFAQHSIEFLKTMFIIFDRRIPTKDQMKSVICGSQENGSIHWRDGVVLMKMGFLSKLADYVRETGGESDDANKFLLTLTDAYREFQEESKTSDA